MTDPTQDLIEGLCGVMHDAYEAAAAKAGWETQERSRKPWVDVPEANKVTMRAAVAAALDALTFMGWMSPEEVAAREAAARREALLEAAEKHRHEVERLEAEVQAWKEQADINVFRGRLAKFEAKVARVEALAKDMRMWCSPEGIATDYAMRIEAALAEPERDKEGGR